jgi:hypothetical protein
MLRIKKVTVCSRDFFMLVSYYLVENISYTYLYLVS